MVAEEGRICHEWHLLMSIEVYPFIHSSSHVWLFILSLQKKKLFKSHCSVHLQVLLKAHEPVFVRCERIVEPQIQAHVPHVQLRPNTETPVLGDRERFIQFGQSERVWEQIFQIRLQKEMKQKVFTWLGSKRGRASGNREEPVFLQSQIALWATWLLGVSSWSQCL